MDSVSVAKRRDNKMADYRKNYRRYINFHKHGLITCSKPFNFTAAWQSVLVRLPVHTGMFEIEDELMPDFW